MTFKTTVFAVILFTVIVTLAVQGTTTQQSSLPPESSSENQLLRDILTELRNMNRQSQQSTRISIKAQIALSSVEAQQSQVDRVARQVQSARAESEMATLQRSEMGERIKLLTTQLEGESDLVRHTQLEDELRGLKALATTHEEHQQHLRDDEARLTSQLQIERDKLEVLLHKLASLEQQIDKELASSQ
jgi:hypothetical protein